MHAENMDRFKLESFLKSFRNYSLVLTARCVQQRYLRPISELCRLNVFQIKTSLERKEIERIYVSASNITVFKLFRCVFCTLQCMHAWSLVFEYMRSF